MLFNTGMVRAILEGRKTVTRRAVKPQPKAALYPMPDSMCWPGCFANCEEERVYRPPLQTGDILWVRETWAKSMAGTFMYRADDKAIMVERWHPSIHMPREAARIFLRVTDVRPERLNDITDVQAKAEGVSMPLPAQKDPEYAEYIGGYWGAFADLWDSTIKPKDIPTYGWDANPWVWVIEFERCEKPRGFV
jgi:hypothetical protein